MIRKGSIKQVGLVVYPGCSLLELVAAQGIWSVASRMSSLQSVVVGPTTEFISSSTSLDVKSQKTFDEMPAPDVLIVVGGGEGAIRASEDHLLVDYVRNAGRQASIVASTGTGSLILAAAGLLQGKKATTHWQFAEQLEAMGAAYRHDYLVEDGKFLTGAGSSSAVDLSLLLIARLRNQRLARRAQVMAEWDPAPPSGPIEWSRVDPASRIAVDGTQHNGPRRIALLIYEGLTALDLVGPLEVVTALSRLRPGFEPVVVAERVVPVRSDSRLTFLPNRSFEDLPAPEVVIVPGGGIPTLRAMSDPVVRQYIRNAASTAGYVTSVCTGALLLASVGLLDGRDATTHWAYRRYLPALGARYVRQRWVSSERIINSAGVSAGIDMAMYLVGELTNEETARQVQVDLHYDPSPPFGGIDYEHLPVSMRAIRGLVTSTIPRYAAKPRRMLRRVRESSEKDSRANGHASSS